MIFHFDPETHTYTLDGRTLLSVTSILKEAGMLVYPSGMQDAMMRGKYVHAATEMIDRGTLDWELLDDTLRPYCEAYAKFCRDKNPVIVLSEQRSYHPTHLYAGTPDRVVRMDGFTALLDIKTGTPNPATAIQVAAYKEMVRALDEIVCARCYALHLRDDGNYRLDEMKDRKRNYNLFLAALAVVRWKKESL